MTREEEREEVEQGKGGKNRLDKAITISKRLYYDAGK